MCYEGGIREFVLWHNRHKTPLHEEVVYMAGVRRDAEAEVALVLAAALFDHAGGRSVSEMRRNLSSYLEVVGERA